MTLSTTVVKSHCPINMPSKEVKGLSNDRNEQIPIHLFLYLFKQSHSCNLMDKVSLIQMERVTLIKLIQNKEKVFRPIRNTAYLHRVKVTIVIDVFRAFATAAYVLEGKPSEYKLANKSPVIALLASELINPLLIGKSEKGSDLSYNIPNSPTRVKEVVIDNRPILHRTEAGAKGILQSKGANLILAAAFGNAKATAHYVRKLNASVTLLPMGHEGTTPSLEDHLCAFYIHTLIQGKTLNLTPFLSRLREGPGSYFFSNDQWQYPRDDFIRCLKTNRFNFAIKADINDGYAVLTKI
jgi:2-phosphosulfolactate phosphatase